MNRTGYTGIGDEQEFGKPMQENTMIVWENQVWATNEVSWGPCSQNKAALDTNKDSEPRTVVV